LAAQANQARFAGLGFGAQNMLANLRATTGRDISALGVNIGSNIAAGRRGTGAGLSAIEQLRSGQQVAGGQRALNAQNLLANFGMQGATQLANQRNQTALNMANINMQGAGGSANVAQGLLPHLAAPTQFAGEGISAIGNAANSTLSNLMFAGMMGGGGGGAQPGGGGGTFGPQSFASQLQMPTF
jgi:hypothetical protein